MTSTDYTALTRDASEHLPRDYTLFFIFTTAATTAIVNSGEQDAYPSN